jgi:hypothetical protein
VFVIKNYNTSYILEDEVIKTGENEYRSIKFRHTWYKDGDFFLTEKEARLSIRNRNAGY